ncbi:MAG: M23 family metallopeptidase [Oscillospiraceae bacterium]|jgi:murein DD-endopeptidase MepM/ murein hydrolase activator NlpD
MRSRILFCAFSFLALVSLRLLWPAQADTVRDYIKPAISQEVPLRQDAEALGRALLGGGDAQTVWSRWMDTRESAIRVSGQSASALKPNTAEAFSVQLMTRQNLSGFEHLAGLPEKKREQETPSPVPPSPIPTPTPTPTPTPAPTPDPAQAKLSAFLEEQAAFSDHVVPANVSYSIPALPFAYASPVSGGVSSGFGFREHPIEGGVLFHYGTDFAVQDGTSVLAFADGTVSQAGEIAGYGNCIILAHADGWTTLYAHCGSLLVKAGDSVKEGDKIALSGHSGNVTGPHLHFELRHNGWYVNPEFYC